MDSSEFVIVKLEDKDQLMASIENKDSSSSNSSTEGQLLDNYECMECHKSIIDFILLTKDNKTLFNFLQNHNVLLKAMMCPLCGKLCKLRNDLQWKCTGFKNVKRCNRKIILSCKFSQSLKKYSCFENCKIELKKICMLTYYWCSLKPPITKFVTDELLLSNSTVIEWFDFCRKACVSWCESKKEKLGGDGEIVEIDCRLRKKNNKNGSITDGQYIFGGFERDTKKLFYVTIPDRNQETILTVIKDWIKPKTIIMSDTWEGYDFLGNEGFIHMTVKHNRNFVNSESGAHTQNIVRLWRDLRENIPNLENCGNDFNSYIAEYLWKRTIPNHTARIHSFLKDLVPFADNPFQKRNGETNIDN